MSQEQTATVTTHDGHAPLALQRHYIDGAFRASRAGGTFETRNPATNEVIALASDGQPEDVDDAVAAARRAFDEGPWPRLSATERAGVLRRIASLIRERADDFIRVEVLDTGVPISQARGLAARAAQNFDYYAGVITELHGRSFQVADEFVNYTVHKPVGRGRADHALERAADALDLAPRARARRRQHGRAQARRVGARLLDAARRGARRRGPAEGRVQRRARLRRDRRRAALGASGRQPDLLHRRGRRRAAS